jgi:hypothetical protein
MRPHRTEVVVPVERPAQVLEGVDQRLGVVDATDRDVEHATQ